MIFIKSGLILIVIFVALIGVFSLTKPSTSKISQVKTNQSLNSEDQDNEEESINKIPDDVFKALTQARNTGNPVLGIRADGPSYHIPILMYHYIEHVQDKNDTKRIALNTLPEVLDQQIKTLVQANYDFINASDLANILDGIEPLPAKPVMLTFDDSYRDFYTDAFPILEKYHIKSVQYVITGFINQPNHLTDSQLQEIAKSGIVEIGSHTIHHLQLASTNEIEAKKEIMDSKVQLEKMIGTSVTAFAYPYGSFNIPSIQFAKESGYRTAVSTLPGSSMSNSVRFFAYRLRPGARTGQTLLNFLETN